MAPKKKDIKDLFYRMTLYLPKELDREIEFIAYQKEKNKSEVVREYVAEGIKRENKKCQK